MNKKNHFKNCKLKKPSCFPPFSTVPMFRMSRPLTATYLAFSPDGGDLIVNLGSEQVYIYDKFVLFDKQVPTSWEQLAVMEKTCDKSPLARRNGRTGPPPLPERIEHIKLAGNAEFESGNFCGAIRLYNAALVLCSHPTLYGNRAAALIKRAWSGDTYAALRDCLAALSADPGQVKALLRLVRCLLELGRIGEAGRWMALFRARFPEQVRCQAYTRLEKDLKAASDKETEEKTGEETSSSDNNSSDSNSNSSNLAVPTRPAYCAADFLRTAEGGDEEEGLGGEEEVPPSPVSERGRRISVQVNRWVIYF